MNKICLLFLFLCAPLMFGQVDASTNVSVAINTDDFQFLTEYGDWTTVPRYGKVWRPSVVSSWRPFDHGDWVWTDQGWMWTSYEPYGWAVYHYGNWHHEPRIGWVWIPGYEWSPARVSWISYGDHIGWAPLAPQGVVLPDPWTTSRVRYWNVVDVRNFNRENVIKFRIGRVGRPRANIQIVRTGPRIIDVERVVKRKIDVVKISTVDVKGGTRVFRRVEYSPTVNKRIAVHRTRVEKTVIKAKPKAKPKAEKTVVKKKEKKEKVKKTKKEKKNGDR